MQPEVDLKGPTGGKTLGTEAGENQSAYPTTGYIFPKKWTTSCPYLKGRGVGGSAIPFL